MLRGTSRSWIRGAVALVLMAGPCLSVGAASADVGGESALGQSGGSLILVLDGSGSMKEDAGDGQTRIEAAKQGLNDVIDELPQDAKVGLRVYGSTIADGAGSCKDSELLTPVESVDPAALKSGVKRLKPLGNTPIAYSLKQAADDLPGDGPRSIVLVSDGEENCGGDPCQVAADITKDGASLHVDVVGLQVAGKARNQLQCVANRGGGTYFDVPDAKLLPRTLERLSVRAARGYEPVGQAVEGGTDASSAAAIEDGRWLDTLGDSGTEYYEVQDPGKGTVHLSATVRPVGLGTADSFTVEMGVAAENGTSCGTAKESTAGAFSGSMPITATFSVFKDARKQCGPGPYVVSVVPSADSVQPVSIQVLSERGVSTTKGLPPAAGETDFEAEAAEPSSEPTEVRGSTSPTDAPLLEPGTYSDGILPGETLYYRTKLDWGQQLVCDNMIAAVPSADVYSSIPVTAATLGFLGGRVRNISSGTDHGYWTGDEPLRVEAATVPVRYENRTSTSDYDQRTSVPGDYYCVIRASGHAEDPSKTGALPITLNVGVVGTAGEGKPDYVQETPKSAEDGQDAVDESGGTPWPWIAGGVVVLVGLLTGLLTFLRRRRSRDGATGTLTE